MHALIATRPFATWVTHYDGQQVVNHLPFLLHSDRGDLGTLVGHVARPNPVWKALPSSTPSVVIFHGPQGYVTPSWYPSKEVTGKAVPTWNYFVVHAHGVARAIDDRDWLRAHVKELTERHEHDRSRPWTIDDAPPEYIDALLNAIVGIEIPIQLLDGKRKLSQNRSEQDLAGVVAGLSAAEDRDPDMIQLVSDALTAKRSGPSRA
jgi:transcriptional regulator